MTVERSEELGKAEVNVDEKDERQTTGTRDERDERGERDERDERDEGAVSRWATSDVDGE
jgi:hypothetical protein